VFVAHDMPATQVKVISDPKEWPVSAQGLEHERVEYKHAAAAKVSPQNHASFQVQNSILMIFLSLQWPKLAVDCTEGPPEAHGCRGSTESARRGHTHRVQAEES
jgi:hypothetical protein